MDIDAVVFKTMTMKTRPWAPRAVSPRSSDPRAPFILKGIMTVRDAVLAVETGLGMSYPTTAAGAGRMAGTMDVLEKYGRSADASYHDRRRLPHRCRCAQGACPGRDYVLIRRPIAIAVGMGPRG